MLAKTKLLVTHPDHMTQRHAYHSISAAGFGVLLATFALHKCPYLEFSLGASSIVLTLALTGLCLKLIVDESKQYKKNKKGTHALKALAFSCAGVGTFSISLFVTLMNTVGMKRLSPYMKYFGPVPAVLLLLACLIFTYTHSKQKNTLHARCAFLQALGLAFIFIGALQEYGSVRLLPQSGRSLHALNATITVFATLASLAAFTMMVLNVRHAPSSEIIQQKTM